MVHPLLVPTIVTWHRGVRYTARFHVIHIAAVYSPDMFLELLSIK